MVEVDEQPACLAGHVLDRHQRPGEVPDGVEGHALLHVDVGLDDHVRGRGGHADERPAFGPLAVQEGEIGGVVVLHLPVDDLDLARAAGAVGAGVG